MTIDNAIFAFRFKSNESLKPRLEDLDDFLRNMQKEGNQGQPDHDLERYRELVDNVEDFEQSQLFDSDKKSLQDKLLYSVLGHSQFANTELLSAATLYRYHMHALSSLDFTSPLSFIKSAEKEMARLSPKRIDHVVRIARLQEMIAERKKIVAQLKRRWQELAIELRRIALYIRGNLVKIEKLCETAVVVLAELEIGKKMEKQLTEDIKIYIKDQVRETLRSGQIVKENLENAKKEYDLLSTALSVHIREDSDALTRLYETIHDHIKKVTIKIAERLADIESNKNASVQDNTELFRGIEQALVALLSDYRFELKLSGIHTDPAHEGIIMDKRETMLEYLIEEVQKERRSKADRRFRKDRRKVTDPNYKGPERRSSGTRRMEAGSRRSEEVR